MHRRVGFDRYLMIALLVASVLHVGLAAPADVQVVSSQPADLLTMAQRSVGETANAAEKMMWGAGKFLLGAGESVNYVMDVAIGSALGLLKAGGRAYDALATRVGHVPVIGFGAAGVNEAVKTTLDAMASDAQHSMQVRRRAFEKLNSKMSASVKRLQQQAPTASVVTNDAYHAAPSATVVFPQA